MAKKVKSLPLVGKEDRAKRIEICNKIIQKIASYDRTFFKYKEIIANIFEHNGALYMQNEYSRLTFQINTTDGYPPREFHHGGTLWGLTKDMVDFIITGEKSNHNHGYGGLYCRAWGYKEESMDAIQSLAVELGYL